MIQQYDYFQNFICQRVLPLVYDESLSYYEVLQKLSTYVNEMVTSVNTLIDAHNDLTGEYSKLLDKMNDFQQQLNNITNGDFLKNGSITLNKLSPRIMEQLRQWITDYIYNLHAFLTFGLDDDYFVIYIPQTWKDINFSTGTDNDDYGKLILEFN